MADILIVSGNETYVLHRSTSLSDPVISGGFTDDDVDMVISVVEPLLPDAEVRLIDEVALRKLEEERRLQVYHLCDRGLYKLDPRDEILASPLLPIETRPFNGHPRSPRETRRSQRNGRRR